MTALTANSTYDELINDAKQADLDEPVKTLIIQAANEARREMREGLGPKMDYEFKGADTSLGRMLYYTTGIMTFAVAGLVGEDAEAPSSVVSAAREWANNWAKAHF